MRRLTISLWEAGVRQLTVVLRAVLEFQVTRVALAITIAVLEAQQAASGLVVMVAAGRP